MKTARFLLAATAFVSLASPALARNVVADVSQIADVLNAQDVKAEVKDTNSGRMVLVTGVSMPFVVIPFGCDDNGSNCKSVQLYATVKATKTLSADKMNAWSRDHRWGRFYIDKDGDGAIEFDIDLEQGGMSSELFVDNVAYFLTSAKAFKEGILN